MRTIDISTEVFAKIWASRIDGEESENAILARLLGVVPTISSALSAKFDPEPAAANERVLWRDDVRAALLALDGAAPLRSIYDKVRTIRLAAGRSVPANLEAIVRRELEYNSSSSNVFKGQNDWFLSVGGIGKGVWAIREAEPS